MLLFLKSRLKINRPHKVGYSVCVAITAVLMSINSIPGIFSSIGIPEFLIFMIPTVYLSIIAKDKWYTGLFWGSILILIFNFTVSLSMHVMTSILCISYDAMMEQTIWRVIYVFVANSFASSALYAIAKFRKDEFEPEWPVLLPFLATTASLYVTEELVYKMQITEAQVNQGNLPSLLGAYIGFTVSLVLIVLLYHMMSQSSEKIHRYKAESIAIEQSKQYQEDLSRMYTNLCHTQHDLKQHYQIIQELIATGGNEKAKAYLSKFSSDFDQDQLFHTGCTSVDALLMTKYLTMKKEQITFHFSPYPLEKLPIRETSFCTIIGNLLDNATEGVLRLLQAKESRTIQLTFSQSWDMFYIYCTNPCDPSTITYENGHWITSKDQDSALHGVGIRSIERLVKEVEGRCFFEVIDNNFKVKIVLPVTTTD